MKVILFLILIAGISTLTVGTLMPGIGWFDFQEVIVLDGKTAIEQVGWDFICECVPMAMGDSDGDGQEDCGFENLPNGQPNLNCEPRPCKDDMTMLPNDFCSVCSVSNTQCDVPPNESAAYFESAEICNVSTLCP